VRGEPRGRGLAMFAGEFQVRERDDGRFGRGDDLERFLVLLDRVVGASERVELARGEEEREVAPRRIGRLRLRLYSAAS